MNNSGRVFGLDILRSIAILLVVYAHTFQFINTPYYFLFDGVALFFVLSGYLIGGILIKLIHSADFSFKELRNFWLRRWFRTLPAYFFVLTILVLLELYQGKALGILDFKEYYLFIQNIFEGWPSLYEESWSLSIEEWFYISFPLCLFLSLKFKRVSKDHLIVFWICFFIVAGTIIRLYRSGGYDNFYEWQKFVRQPLVNRFDSIMYGVLAAYISHKNLSILKRANLLFWVGMIVCVLTTIIRNVYGFGWFMNYAYLSLQSIGVLLLLPKCAGIKNGKGYLFKWLTFISKISYSIYLLNMTPFNRFINIYFIETSLIKLFGNDWVLDFVKLILFFVWSFGAAYLLYRFVELPWMKFRERITTEKSFVFKQKRML